MKKFFFAVAISGGIINRRMFNSIPNQFPVIGRRMLVYYFLFSCNSFVFGQTRSFQLVSQSKFRVENQFVTLKNHTRIQLTADTVQNKLYSHISSDIVNHKITILEYDLLNGKSISKTIDLSKDIKLDFRNSLSNVGLDYSTGLLYLQIDKMLLFIDLAASKVVATQKIKDADYVFVSENQRFFGSYSNASNLKNKEKAQLIKPISKKKYDVLNFSTEDIALTSFSRRKSILKSNDYFYWCHVSKPILYRYNLNFALVDSLVFDTTWTLPQSLLKLPKYSDLAKGDIYSFYMKAIDDTIHVNMSIQFLNDKSIMVTTLNKMDSTIEDVIDVSGPLKLNTIFRNSVKQDLSSELNCKFSLQSAYGTLSNNKLYYMDYGKPEFPWEVETEKPEYSKFTYFHLYIFDYIK